MQNTGLAMSVVLLISFLRLLVAIPLFISARRNRLTSLLWLSAQFLCLAIALPFVDIGVLDNPWIFWPVISIAYVSLIMFVHITFYQDRRSPTPVFMSLTLIALVGGMYASTVGYPQLLLISPCGALVWSWHTIEAYRAYRKVENDLATARWVKARYQMMIAYGALNVFSSIFGILAAAGLEGNILVGVLGALVNFSAVGLQLLTWAMPERFRLWLDRNRNAKAQTNSEDKPASLSVLDISATAMMAGTGLKSMACHYAIRAAVGKKIDSEDPALIQQYLNLMTYDEWNKIVQHPEVRRILINSGASHTAANQAVENARNMLVEKQSLLTLAAR